MKIPENLENAAKRNFLVFPEYFCRKVPNSIDGVYLKSEILDLLETIETKMPKNIRFLLWDGYRPKIVQEYLFNSLFDIRKKEFPHYDNEKIRSLVKIFVAEPNNQAPHLTGRAIDLTLFNLEENCPIEMQGEFDEFTERSSVNFFEKIPPKNIKQKEAKKNREFLASIMKKHGFEMIDSEWWHFQLF